MDSISGISVNNIIKIGTNDRNVGKLDFKEFLIESLEKVNSDQIKAEEMDKALMAGEIDNLHDVMIASQKAELSLSFAIEVRNKILEAYKEIMRIQM